MCNFVQPICERLENKITKVTGGSMNILLIGPQGSGKGTLAKNIQKDFGLIPISTGDLFRESIANGEKLGLEAKTYMDKGVLVPLELTLGILQERLKKPDCQKGIMIDGFPRSIEQAEALKKILEVDLVINVQLPYDECVKRMLDRRVCEKCGAISNINWTTSPTCDKCGGKLVQRDDDKLDAIKTRLEVYEKQTAPLIDFYAGKVFTVNSQNSPEETYALVKNFLKGKI